MRLTRRPRPRRVLSRFARNRSVQESVDRSVGGMPSGVRLGSFAALSERPQRQVTRSAIGQERTVAKYRNPGPQVVERLHPAD
jgi:hypothetical protein